MVHFLIPGISRPYLDFPVKAPNEENQDYCHKLVIRLHRVCCHFSHVSYYSNNAVEERGNKNMWFRSEFVSFLNTLFSSGRKSC